MHDATQVQLPHCGSAFYDETGEETPAYPPCLRLLPASVPLPRLFPLPGALFLPLPSASFWLFYSSPSLDCEPGEGRTILASALS